MRSFINEIESKTQIYHIKTVDPVNGLSMHVFLKPSLFKKTQLDKLLSTKEFINFSEYGEVVASCHGRYVPVEISKMMKEKYNFDC